MPSCVHRQEHTGEMALPRTTTLVLGRVTCLDKNQFPPPTSVLSQLRVPSRRPHGGHGPLPWLSRAGPLVPEQSSSGQQVDECLEPCLPPAGDRRVLRMSHKRMGHQYTKPVFMPVQRGGYGGPGKEEVPLGPPVLSIFVLLKSE